MYMFGVFINDDTGFFCALIISSMYLKLCSTVVYHNYDIQFYVGS